MFQSVLSQFKSFKPSAFVQDLKSMAQSNIESLQADAFFKKAGEVVSHAVALTEEELHKAVQNLVHKALAGREDVTESEKIEIACMLSEFEKTPRGFADYLKARTGFVFNHLPKSLDDVRNLKTSVVDALVAEARQRLNDSGLNGDGSSSYSGTNRIIPKHKSESAGTKQESTPVKPDRASNARTFEKHSEAPKSAVAPKAETDVAHHPEAEAPKPTAAKLAMKKGAETTVKEASVKGARDPRKKGYPEKPKSKNPLSIEGEEG